MHYLLEKLFNKRGIKDTSALNNSEKGTYDRWQRILSEGEITVDKIRDFCKAQISLIESKWRDLDNLPQKNERYIIMHTVYKTLIDAIDKPQKERENLEKYLQQLVDSEIT